MLRHSTKNIARSLQRGRPKLISDVRAMLCSEYDKHMPTGWVWGLSINKQSLT